MSKVDEIFENLLTEYCSDCGLITEEEVISKAKSSLRKMIEGLKKENIPTRCYEYNYAYNQAINDVLNLFK